MTSDGGAQGMVRHHYASTHSQSSRARFCDPDWPAPLGYVCSPTLIFLRHAHDQFRNVPHDSRSTNASSVSEILFLCNQPPMPTQQGIWRDYGVKLKQSLSADGFGFARQKNALSVAEANSLAAKSTLEQLVLSLKEFDDNRLVAMDPTSGDHQQEREYRWHRTHANILPSVVRIFGQHGIGKERVETNIRHST